MKNNNIKQALYPIEPPQYDIEDDSTEPMPFGCDSTGTQSFHVYQDVHGEYMATARAQWRRHFKGQFKD